MNEEPGKPPTHLDTRAADGLYEPFAAFSRWSTLQVDEARWRHFSGLLFELRERMGPEESRRALGFVRRAAAVDTGAIEALYEVDRGFTFTMAAQAQHWEDALQQKSPTTQRLIRSQLDVYEQVLDFATGRQPIVESWIRDLHASLCAAQPTYRVLIGDRFEDRPLPMGTYKSSPNHVMKRDGSVHAYSPVDQAPAEMHRLVVELGTPEFLAANPVLQAAYAHYAFVWIHPFADGNGRVARALASVFLYRAISMPFTMFADQRDGYMACLEQADAGAPQAFVDFVFARSVDAIMLARQSFEGAESPDLSSSARALADLLRTPSGLTHQQVDAAGRLLAARVVEELQLKAKSELDAMGLQFNGRVGPASVDVVLERKLEPGMREVVEGGPVRVGCSLNVPAPANANINKAWKVVVPRQAGNDDFVKLVDLTQKLDFEARIVDLHPQVSSALVLSLKLFAHRVIAKMVEMAKAQAAKSLRDSGYS